MWTITVQKTVPDSEGNDIQYAFAASAFDEAIAEMYVCAYASMVEYGLSAQRWAPGEMAFPREQLYQFIQRDVLATLEAMYENTVPTAYANAMAYIQSYFGNMYDIDAMLSSGDTSSTALTLRLALCISTVIFILASSPNYSETVETHNKQLHFLLRGLKSGQRNMGKAGIAAEPNVRLSVVSLSKIGSRP